MADSICVRVDCGNRQYRMQHCRRHYNWWRQHGTLIVDAPSDVIDAAPLVEAVRSRLSGRTLQWLLPDPADQRAYHRAVHSGRITEVFADRICIRALHMTIDEVYSGQEGSMRRKLGPTSWMGAAACAGLEGDDADAAFGDDARQAAFALRFCRECPVREDCFEYSRTNRFAYGVFGGMTGPQRRRLLGMPGKVA